MKDKTKEKLKKAIQFIANPRLLVCLGIAWIITNGWSYVCLGLGTVLGWNWMIAIATAYMAFLWFPFTPEKILTTIITKFKGGPVGLSTIATALGEDPGTIEEVYEPFLIKEGFIKRTPRGREVTDLAYTHLGHSRIDSGSLF
jgi:hypothetical protein